MRSLRDAGRHCFVEGPGFGFRVSGLGVTTGIEMFLGFRVSGGAVSGFRALGLRVLGFRVCYFGSRSLLTNPEDSAARRKCLCWTPRP